jgi:hypothetical protein
MDQKLVSGVNALTVGLCDGLVRICREYCRDIIRDIAMEGLDEFNRKHGTNISVDGESPRRGRGRGRKVTRTSPSRAVSRRKWTKRDPKSIDALATKLATFIKSNPGKRMEDIAASLRSTTKELALPARKLLDEKKISKKGERRATLYFPK